MASASSLELSPLAATADSLDVSAWEDAYRRFETPDQEVRKFVRRLTVLGANHWPRNARIVELFCGRGNGLVALERLSFTELTGVDLSPALLSTYRGRANVHVADCRQLPLANRSRDIVIVQGGLHHLQELPRDLESVLREVDRVLVQGGLFIVVEPWRTLFLDVVHAACQLPLVRRCSPCIAALHTMIEHERPTYEEWLRRPAEIASLLASRFVPQQQRIGWGKLMFVGAKRNEAGRSS